MDVMCTLDAFLLGALRVRWKRRGVVFLGLELTGEDLTTETLWGAFREGSQGEPLGDWPFPPGGPFCSSC